MYGNRIKIWFYVPSVYLHVQRLRKKYEEYSFRLSNKEGRQYLVLEPKMKISKNLNSDLVDVLNIKLTQIDRDVRKIFPNSDTGRLVYKTFKNSYRLNSKISLIMTGRAVNFSGMDLEILWQTKKPQIDETQIEQGLHPSSLSKTCTCVPFFATKNVFVSDEDRSISLASSYNLVQHVTFKDLSSKSLKNEDFVIDYAMRDECPIHKNM